MGRKEYVAVGDAARIAGVSVDTLRRWDDAGVFKNTIRTPGGQRRFSVEELERVRDGSASAEVDAPAAPRPELPRTRTVQSWEAREAEAKADVTVTRARIERREEVRRYRESEAARAEEARAEAEARSAEAREREAANARRERTQQALDDCLRRIRYRLTLEPAPARAEVERFLAEHAVIDVSLPWIEAEVSAIHARHRSAREAEASRERDESSRRMNESIRKMNDDVQRTLLLNHAIQHARSLTADRDAWDSDIAEEAVDSVREQLTTLVLPTWTKKQVERAVEEVIEQWD